MDNLIPLIITGMAGLSVGALLTWLVMKSKATTAQSELKIKNAELIKQIESDQDKMNWLESTETKIRETFESLASRALKDNSEQILSQTKEQLDAMHKLMKGDWKTQNQEFKNLQIA